MDSQFDQIRAYYHHMVPAIDAAAWADLQGRLTTQLLPKGGVLLRNGDICRYVTFINKGLLRYYYLSEGREVCTGFLAENSYVSEYASFLTQQPATANIDALEDCEVLHLSLADMQWMYRHHPVMETFGRRMAEQLFIEVSNQNSRLLTLSPEERYDWLIDQRPSLLQRVPQYMIASLLGITPEHLSRIRKRKK
ncbi:Crp/Fnr family transcriptional regulator [Paraflavitalea sp. CAU 1676]|uniref:Crp/Fnr family transcriptional regulator n=1 Tax=Paraflavitalea sp. CAU 1676 TaxID=3032598 RepID=UPI0023DC7950|nr:Crp/Fnr family transcriptional regulator [Paraflavitalea sp. CAU 1676]MDF2188878.1 Crp/Fnr family transcriptional regulator [Paraflavitalea sp. CAU 1676]